MSNTLRPVTLVPYTECSTASMPPEATEQPSTYTIGAETSASPFDRLGAFADHVGDLSTYSVIIAQIKTGNAIESAKNYLQLEGGKLVVRTYLAALAIMGGSLAMFLESGAAYADDGPQYTVTDTAVGGVYSRNTPNTEDTSRTAGVGIYPGDNLTLRCGVTDGSPVGPYNNHTWYYVHDNSRSEPDFWANDHYLDTPNAAGQLAPGVGVCENEGANPIEEVSSQSTTTPSDHPLPCTPVLVIGARGSHEPYRKDRGNTTGFGDTLSPIADSLIGYYGDSVTTYGLPYPAVSADPNNTLIHPKNYANSVTSGETLLIDTIAKQIRGCPNQTIDLVGYSQGADVVNYAMTNFSDYERAHIGGVVALGDPHFNPRSVEDRGSFSTNAHGILGTREEVPNDMLQKTRSYCDSDDYICNFSPRSIANNNHSHFHYGDGDAIDAAMFLESLRQKDTAPYA